MPEPLTEAEMIERAARGVGKVDYHGPRGITLVTMDEIEAMATLLACFGLKAICPGKDVQEPPFYSQEPDFYPGTDAEG